MFEKEIAHTIKKLQQSSIRLEKGMTLEQIQEAEEYYEFTFPPDLKALLMTVLPVSYPFYDWTDYSDGNENRIKQYLEWPIEGALFDLENSGVWIDELYGQKPDQFSEQLKNAEQCLRAAPKLIPIYSHRYIPSVPNEALNPVFSVQQTDIIYYGANLWDYFEHEFGGKDYASMDIKNIKQIPFWSYFTV